MYHEIGGHLIWVSDSKPHWKEWRGKVVYRQRNEQMAAISSDFALVTLFTSTTTPSLIRGLSVCPSSDADAPMTTMIERSLPVFDTAMRFAWDVKLVHDIANDGWQGDPDAQLARPALITRSPAPGCSSHPGATTRCRRN